VLTACGRLGFEPTSGGDGGDGGIELPCNLAGRVTDTFDDGIVDEYVWGSHYEDPGTAIAEANGRVTFKMAPNAASSYATLKTSRFYDMHGQRFIVEVVSVGNAGSNVGMQIEYRNDRFVSLMANNGNLRAAYKEGSFTTVDTIPYVPAQHRYWALSEDGGVIHFETSEDGISFTSFASVPTPFDVSLVRQTTHAGTDNMVASPGTFVIESVGSPVPVASAACPASTFVDTFDDGVIDHRWENSYNDPCCSLDETGGQMVMAYDGTQGTVSLRSSAGLDLRDNQVSLRVTQDPVPSTVLNLVVRRDEVNAIELQIGPAQTNARVLVAGVADNVVGPRDPSERYLRIRESGGSYWMDVSTDGAAWRTLRTGTNPFPLDDVLTNVRGGVSANGSPQTLASFDDFNAP
jgi:hypothetical protein